MFRGAKVSASVAVAHKHGPAYAHRSYVKKAVFRAHPGKNGFIRTSLSTAHKHEPRFGWWDMVTLAALIVGGLALARVLMAH
jgi:hypothetical protein